VTDTLPVALSPRDREIFCLLADGASHKQIAGRLSITVWTVKWHCKRVRERLGVETTAAAIYQLHDLIAPMEEK
jgi:DNA-binding CsgD family transcriptional regulator